MLLYNSSRQCCRINKLTTHFTSSKRIVVVAVAKLQNEQQLPATQQQQQPKFLTTAATAGTVTTTSTVTNSIRSRYQGRFVLHQWHPFSQIVQHCYGLKFHSNHHYNGRRSFASSSDLPPHEIVGLPSLSPTMESGSISNWNVKAGDSVVAGDVYASIETDKAVVDFEAQDDGIVAQILVPVGTEVKVNTPVMILVSEPSHVKAFENYTVASTTTDTPVSEPAPAATAAATPAPSPPPSIVSAPSAPSSSPSTTGSMFASPLARKLAKEMGYDIQKIPGTGPNHRVIAADVKEYQPTTAAVATAPTTTTSSETTATAASTPTPPPTTISTPIAGSGFVDYPIPTTVAEIASRLGQSKRNVPHYYLTVEINADELIQLRNSINTQLNSNKKSPTTSIGMYEYFIKAAGLSMKTIPSANASWMETHVRMYDSVDVNIVTGAGDTLNICTIRNITGIGIQSISNELQKVTSEDGSATMDNGLGTFTMINVGMYGVKSCAPIIREPQACAIAIGALQHKIVPSTTNEKGYTSSVVFTVTASFDHRVVDGAVGAQWLSAFKSYIENPNTLLL